MSNLVFFGLGNNAEKYLNTKHNVGRVLLENIVRHFKLNYQSGQSYKVAKTITGNISLFFIYNLGFMNQSGSSLASGLDFFKLDVKKQDFKLIILQDDSDQIEGKYKFSQNGGSAGHRGIEDIYKMALSKGLDLQQIYRLKIGIRPLNNKQKSETFVLKSISNFQKQQLLEIQQRILEIWPSFLNFDLSLIQNKINTK